MKQSLNTGVYNHLVFCLFIHKHLFNALQDTVLRDKGFFFLRSDPCLQGYNG